MFIEITDKEIVNLNNVSVIRRECNEKSGIFKIYVCIIDDGATTITFDTKEELEKKWNWLRHTVTR